MYTSTYSSRHFFVSLLAIQSHSIYKKILFAFEEFLEDLQTVDE